MFDVIERLKSEWTDRFVVINSSAPELARFANATGRVKTVNMNGRCLVEFDQYNNIGWYDIDPAALKIVPQPLPKPPAKESPAKPSAAKPAAAKADAAKPTAAKTSAAKPGVAGRPSTADILAAARGKPGNAGAAAGAQPAAKPAAGKLSTAEILAQARAAKAGGAVPSVQAPSPRVDQEEQEVAAEPAAAVEKPAATKKPAASVGPAPATTAEKIAWCRQHDAKG